MSVYEMMDDLKDSILRFYNLMPSKNYWIEQAKKLFKEYLDDWREEVRDYAERCLYGLEMDILCPW